MHTDPISDMLTRIRNALAVKKPEVIFPYSKLKYQVAKILEENFYIGTVEKMSLNLALRGKKQKPYNQIRIELKYKNDKPAITDLKRISKPGRRIYVSRDKLPYVLNNLGIAIISTSSGLMTNKEAKKKGIGGEVLCEVY